MAMKVPRNQAPMIRAVRCSAAVGERRPRPPRSGTSPEVAGDPGTFGFGLITCPSHSASPLVADQSSADARGKHAYPAADDELTADRLGAETADVEVGQHGMSGAVDDFAGHQLAGDQAEGRTAVGEGEREARHVVDWAEYRVAVAGDGFPADAGPV